MKQKKMVASLLTLCMITGLLPVTALASNEAVTAPDGIDTTSIGQYLDVTLAQGSSVLVINGNADSRIISNPHAVEDKIGDTSFMLRDNYNMLSCFGSKGGETDTTGSVSGFTFSGGGNLNYGSCGGGDDTSYSYESGFITDTGADNPATATITIDDNDTLKAMAESGQLYFRFNGKIVGGYDTYWDGTDYGWAAAKISVTRDGVTTVLAKDNGDIYGNCMDTLDTGWYLLQPGDVITLYCHAGGDVASNYPGLGDAGLYFKDVQAPTLVSYDLSTNGSAYYNSALQRTEILLKQYGVSDSDTLNTSETGYIDMNINFSEGVFSSQNAYTGMNDYSVSNINTNLSGYKLLSQLANHKLFTNTEGTGYQNAGQAVDINLVSAKDGQGEDVTILASDADAYAKSQVVALTDKNSPVKTLSYHWETETGAYYGNNPIPGGGDWSGSVTMNNAYSLIDKIYLASLHDAAGNPLVRSDGAAIVAGEIGTEESSVLPGSVTLRKNDGTDAVIETNATTVSPFDEYAFIIDDVPPTYSVTSNGIQPNILTQLTLNKEDTIEFLVNFSESMCLRRYAADGKTALNWKDSETYIEFNNGMKAYYTGGTGTKQWKFSMTVPEGLAVEITALEAVALANDAHTADKYVLTDYVGNPLVQAAGVDKLPDGTLVNSEISWAKLGVDNSAPNIAFSYGNTGTEPVTSNTDWGREAYLTINASDPKLSTTANGSGIFRILNATGDPVDMTTGGMVYYVWVKGAGDGADDNSVDDAVDAVISDLTANNFAALKLYSLAMVQPEAYSGKATKAGTLQVANNDSAITTPEEMYTSASSGEWYLVSFTADMTWDSARQLIQYNKLKSYKMTEAGMAAYMVKFNEYGSTTYESLEAAQNAGYASYNDAVYSADRAVMEEVGQYANWTSTDYTADDSNWTSAYTAVKLDNTVPSAGAVSAAGNNTDEVKVSFTASDADSGVKSVEYAFAAKGGAQPDAWTDKPVAGVANEVSLTISTKDGSLGDGAYDLWVKVTDDVGVEYITKLFENMIVDSSHKVEGEFSIAPNQTGKAVKNIAGLKFSAGAMHGSTALAISVKYAITDSTATPSSWTNLTAGNAGETINGVATKVYTIDTSALTDGIWYVHVSVTDSQGSSEFQGVYKIDSTAPTVTFSPPETAYAQENADISVSVTDAYGGKLVKYMWVEQTDGATVPTTATADGWTSFAEGETTLSIKATDAVLGIEAGQSKSFKLYIYATDEAGNDAVCASKEYTLTRPKSIEAPTEVSGDLLAISGDAAGGYTGIVDITIGGDKPATAEELVGIRYSTAIVSEGRETVWSRWLPYESMVSVALGNSANLTGKQLWVKFRSVSGEVSAEENYIKITNLSVPSTEPVWATVSRDTFKMIPATGTVTLQINLSDGAEATLKATEPAQENISEVSANDRCEITANGCYTFDITKEGEDTKTLSVVVDNFDTERPVGSVRYSTTAPTGSNVTAFLTASEDITVTSITTSFADGVSKTVTGDNQQFVFEKNGTAVFTFKDEAGNISSCTASVTWIDRSTPGVSIQTIYSYNGKTYNTIKDGGGNVILAQGAMLRVESTEGKALTIISGTNSPDTFVKRVSEDGAYSFTVSDALGNKNTVTETVGGIISSTSAPTVTSVTFAYKDAGGNITPAAEGDTYVLGGVTYAKNKANLTTLAKVTLSGSVEGYAKGNRAYDGAVKNVNDSYSNLIDGANVKGGGTTYACDGNGNYTITKYYSAGCTVQATVCDALGNTAKYSYGVTGLDNSKPSLKFDSASVIYVNQNEPVDSAALVAKGGFAAEDNATPAKQLEITARVSDINFTTAGSYDVAYTVTDLSGNSFSRTRKVFVIPTDGLLVFGNNLLLYSASKDAVLLDSSAIQFSVSRYDLMEYGTTRNGDGTWNTETVTNEWATYDIYIQQGAYREGQLKYIQTLTLKGNSEGTITIPVGKLTSTGVYTIIIRNQEREREFTTFFITYIDPTA